MQSCSTDYDHAALHKITTHDSRESGDCLVGAFRFSLIHGIRIRNLVDHLDRWTPSQYNRELQRARSLYKLTHVQSVYLSEAYVHSEISYLLYIIIYQNDQLTLAEVPTAFL
jgi:hypothetical protein